MKKIILWVGLALLCLGGAAVAQAPNPNDYPDPTGIYSNSSKSMNAPNLMSDGGRNYVQLCRERAASPSNPPSQFDRNCAAMLAVYDRNQVTGAAAVAKPNRSFDAPPQIDPGFTAAIKDPATGISKSYEGCVDEQQVTKQERTDTMLCTDAYGRSFNNACSKTLSVTVTYQATCSPTATRVVQTFAGPPPLYRCEYDTTVYSCNPGDTLSGTTCTPPIGAPYAATSSINTTTSSATVTAIETDNWANGCSAMEARVPPGFLPPDGNNTIPTGVPSSGSVNKCLRTSSACTQLGETRTINGHDVTRSCWGWSNAFTCIEPNPATCEGASDGAPNVPNPNPGSPCSSCPQLLSSGVTCTENAGSPYCRPDGTDPTTGLCTVFEHAYNCVQQAQQTTTVTNCGSQKYCTGGVCYDAGYPPDADFAKSVTALEAAREGGKYMDYKDMTNIKIFGGVDSRCVRKLGGLVNCCSSGGLADLISDLKAGAEALKDLGDDLAKKPSDYVGDALFSDSRPGWVSDGLFIVGITLQDPRPVLDFLQGLGGMAWDLAMEFVTLFGLLSCDDPNKVTVMRKNQGLCHYVDDYCSDSFLGVCLARRNTYCCYNSRLARILHEKARSPDLTGVVQLNKPWGSGENPDCSGFTPEQMQTLNFANLDLSEFYDSITTSGGPVTRSGPSNASSNVSATVPNCLNSGGPCKQPEGLPTYTCNPGDILSGNTCIRTVGGPSYAPYPVPPPAPEYPYDPNTDPSCKYTAPGYTRPARCG